MAARKKKSRKGIPRHRSPVPPPGRVIDKTSYRRSAEKYRTRRDVEEEL